MKNALQIVFQNMAPSPAIEKKIEGRYERLTGHYSRISGCRVTVAKGSGRTRHGQEFQVAVALDMPGSDIVVHRRNAGGTAASDLARAVADAFAATERALRETVQRRKGSGQRHQYHRQAERMTARQS